MNPFARFAFFTVARDTTFVTLAALLLMLALCFELSLAFEVVATVALAFSVGQLGRAYFLTEERLERTEAWRALTEEERPSGDDGRRWAREHLETLLLRCAKGASGFACALYGAALLMAMVSALASQPDSSQAWLNSDFAQIALR
jgi:hypothetical protein